MDRHQRRTRRTALCLALLLSALVALLSAGLVSGLGESARAWLLTAGFALLVAAVALSPRRAIAPLAVAVVFVLYGGVSALVAVPESAAQQARHAKGLSKDQVEASQRSPGFVATHGQEERAFKKASLLTGLAGLIAVAAAYLAAGTADAREGGGLRRRTGAGRMEMAGRSLVFVAFLGVAAALARFFLTQIPTNDLHMAIKSFWNGGSYFLLVATFAIPGFGLWLQGVLHRSHSRHDLLRLGAWAIVYLALLVPTGQRGFAIALAAMVVVILAFDGILKARHLVVVTIVGILLLGVTQAARNEVREEGGLGPSGYVSRLAPSEWKSLYASQLASFNWTVQVIEFEAKLDIPNPFPQVLLKPVPRQIDPSKSQGFGAEFTRRVYPGAARQEVSFAIPLTAESYYGFGIVGLIVVMALLGGGAGLAESRLAARGDSMAMPLVMATMGWCLFVLIRGDLANALVFASGWVIPLLLVSRSIGLRRDAKPERVVLDALQVAPEFSGIGRRVAEIGRSLREDGCPLPLTVRCAADVAERLRDDFPAGTVFHTPLRSSRPRVLRILYQQLVAPLRDAASTVLVCPGDQAPVWGRAQLVFVVHDVRRLTHPETSTGRIEAAYYKATMTFGARRARRIVTISAFSLAEIERTLGPTCPIVVVSAHPAPQEPRSAAPGGELTLLTVGALRGYKGIETLIEALSMLGSEAPRPRVICVGAEEGGDGYLEALAAHARGLGVDRSFELTGWLPEERLRELYANCSGTVNPSTYEGYGLPVAESLADGLPTIASDIPPHREIAGDAALYFPPGDAAALAGALDRLRRDPGLREDLARRAAARARQLAGSASGWAEALLAEVGDPDGALDGDLALAAAR